MKLKSDTHIDEQTTSEIPEAEVVSDVATDDNEDGNSTRYQISVAILIAIVTFVGIVIGWEASTISPGDSEQAGLRAVLNTESTRILNAATLHNNLRAHAVYTLNTELLQRFDETPEILAAASNPMVTSIESAEKATVSDLVAVSRQFFSTNYLEESTGITQNINQNIDKEINQEINQDTTQGNAIQNSYDQEQHLAELWAQARQKLDLDASTHFEVGGQQGNKILHMTLMICWLTGALFFLTLAEVLHSSRRLMQYGAIALGLVCFGAGIEGMWDIWRAWEILQGVWL
ncbi:MAG: hypothetical protein AAF639_44560 [Chloroflexota bacterium]